MGLPQTVMAHALRISRNTLAKHYFEELTRASAVSRMEALDALFIAAKRGNVAAICACIGANKRRRLLRAGPDRRQTQTHKSK